MKPSNRMDRPFRILLWISLLIGVGSAISWALGWEPGAFGIFIAMAISSFPLFHFAMHWPMRDRGNTESEE